MTYLFPPDVARLIEQHMATGGYASADDVLRVALRALDEDRRTIVYDDPETVAGIERGLSEMRQGLGRPFEEFDAEFRASRGAAGDD